ncbi:EpsG family protein [Acinetobacter seifertii]|uniref:EpsG family protein n=1 Tax=Acinetobacter seifertii TaxID=1530123 RepID=UPI003BDE4E47
MYLIFLVIYLYNFLLVFLLPKISNTLIYFFYAPLVFFLAFYGAENIKVLSVDYLNYFNWFYEIYHSNSISFFEDKDPGFSLIVKCIQSIFGLEYFYIYFIFIVMIILFKIKISILYLPKKMIAFFLLLCFCKYYIVHDLTQFRAGFVIVLSTFFYYYLVNKKIGIIPFSISILILSSIHSSILIFLIIVLLDFYFKFLDKKKFIYVTFIISFISYFLSVLISGEAGSLLVNNARFNVYQESGDFEIASISIFSFLIVIKIITIFINILIWDNLNTVFKAIASLTCISLFLALSFSHVAVLGWRFSELFAYFELLSIFSPLIFLRLNMYSRIFYIIFWFLISFFMLYSNLLILNIGS